MEMQNSVESSKDLFLKRQATRYRNILNDAKKYISKGDYELACDYLDVVISSSDLKEEAYFLKGITLVKMGIINSARTVFCLLLDTSFKDRANLELAKIYIQIGETDKARISLGKLLNTSVKNDALFELGKLDNSYNILKEVFDETLNYEVLLEQAKLDVRLGNYDKASKAFESLLSTQYKDKAQKYLTILNARLGCKNNFELKTNDTFNNQTIYRYIKECMESYNKTNYYTMVKKHIININSQKFNEEFNLEAVYNDTLEYLKSISIDNTIDVADKYHYFSFDEPIATVDGEETNCIKVTTRVEEKNIIDIQPVIWHGSSINLKEELMLLKGFLPEELEALELKNKCIKLFNEKNYSECKKILEVLINTCEKEYAALQYGIISFMEDNKPLAKRCFKRIVEYDKKYKDIALYWLAKLELNENNLEFAESYITSINENNVSKDKLGYITCELARLYLKRKKKNKAKKFYEKSIRFGNTQYAALNLGKLAVEESDFQKAYGYFGYLLDTESRNFALLEMSKLEVLEGKYDKAREHFKELMTMGEKDRNFALLELGKLEVECGNYKEAEDCFNKLVVKGGKDKQFALIELSKLEVLRENIEVSISYLNQLLDTESRNFALLELGKTEIRLMRFDEARKHLEELKDNYPMDRNLAITELAKLESITKNTLKAREYFNELIAMGGKDEQYAILGLGKLELSLGNNKKARDCFRKLKGSSFEPKILFELGCQEAKAGNINTAREILQPLSLINPFAQLELAHAELCVGNEKEARRLLNKLFNSGIMDANYELGNIELLNGDYDKAEKIYSEFLNCDDYHKSIAKHKLGIIYAKKGDYKKAKTYIEEALEEMGPNYEYIGTIVNSLTALEIYNGNIESAKEILEKYKNNYIDSDYYRFYDYIEIYLNNNEAASRARSDKILRHIKQRHSDEFYDFIDIDRLYKDVTLRLQNFEDKNYFYKKPYYIDFERPVATIDGEETSVIEVANFMDKSNIVTMYPVIWYGDTIKLKEKTKKRIYK